MRRLETTFDAIPGAIASMMLAVPVRTGYPHVEAHRASGLHECDSFAGPPERWLVNGSGVCVRGRSTINDPFPEIPVLVCVDGFQSFGAINELETIDIRDVALIEIFARGRGSVACVHLAISCRCRRQWAERRRAALVRMLIQ